MSDAALAVGFVLWCAVTGWAATDAARRGQSWFAWLMIVGYTGVFGLALWVFLRRRYPTTNAALSPSIRPLLWIAAIAVQFLNGLIATFVVTFLFQVARVEGQTMAPTLNNQDRLIVNKLVYWLHVPDRNDIVMLRYPRDTSKTFVKRVIAMDGDRIESRDGHVFVNDVALNEEYVAHEYRSHDDWGPVTIPPGQYFVLGDHRNNSSDSREWGLVQTELIVGRIAVRWWPVTDVKTF